MVHKFKNIGQASILPRTVKLTMEGIPEYLAHVKDWWWVTFKELLPLIDIIRGDKRVQAPRSPHQFLDRYGLLSGQVETSARLTWVDGVDEELHVDSDQRPPDNIEWLTFIPAGFSTAVIKCVEKGIVKVTPGKQLMPAHESARGPEKAIYELVGHRIDGRTYELRRGSGRSAFDIVPVNDPASGVFENKHGEIAVGTGVSFEVENQSDWNGDLTGTLVVHNGEFKVKTERTGTLTINKGYDIYGSTIKKIQCDSD